LLANNHTPSPPPIHNPQFLFLVVLQVIDELSTLVKVAKKLADKRTGFERLQARAGRVYYSPTYQLIVNVMLFLVTLLTVAQLTNAP
jgi:hypothetical protein